MDSYNLLLHFLKLKSIFNANTLISLALPFVLAKSNPVKAKIRISLVITPIFGSWAPEIKIIYKLASESVLKYHNTLNYMPIQKCWK